MKPITRKEMLMAKAAGQTVPDLEPITREEYFLNQIAESGGGGGGGGATIVECVYDDDAHTLTSSITAKELWEAYAAGGAIVSYTDYQGYATYEIILLAAKGGGNPGYYFGFGTGGFSADADTDYPVANLE